MLSARPPGSPTHGPVGGGWGAACVVCSRAGCRGIELDLELGVPDGRRTLSLELLYAFIYVLCVDTLSGFMPPAPHQGFRLQTSTPNLAKLRLLCEEAISYRR